MSASVVWRLEKMFFIKCQCSALMGCNESRLLNSYLSGGADLTFTASVLKDSYVQNQAHDFPQLSNLVLLQGMAQLSTHLCKQNLEFISYTSDILFHTSHFQSNTISSFPLESSHAFLPSTITRSVDVTTSLLTPPSQLPTSSISSSSQLPLYEWPTILCECKSNHIFLVLSLLEKRIPESFIWYDLAYTLQDSFHLSLVLFFCTLLCALGTDFYGLHQRAPSGSDLTVHLTKERQVMGKWLEIEVRYLFPWISPCCIPSHWLHFLTAMATVRRLFPVAVFSDKYRHRCRFSFLGTVRVLLISLNHSDTIKRVPLLNCPQWQHLNVPFSAKL